MKLHKKHYVVLLLIAIDKGFSNTMTKPKYRVFTDSYMSKVVESEKLKEKLIKTSDSKLTTKLLEDLMCEDYVV